MMRGMLLSSIVWALVMGMPMAHGDVIVVDFEDVTDSQFSQIENPYHGLDWSGLAVVDASRFRSSYPYLEVIRESDTYVAVTDPEVNQVVETLGEGDLFNFDGVRLGTADGPVNGFHSDVRFTMSGYRGGEELYQDTVTLAAGEPIWVEAGFEGIDTLEWHSFHIPGVDGVYDEDFHRLGVENFTFSHTSAQEVIPEPTAGVLLGLGIGLLAWRRRKAA